MQYTFFVHNSGGTQYLIRGVELPQSLTDASGVQIALNSVDDYKARLATFGIVVDKYQTAPIADTDVPKVYIQPAPVPVNAPAPAGAKPFTVDNVLISAKAFFRSSVGVLVILAAVAWFALHMERGA